MAESIRCVSGDHRADERGPMVAGQLQAKPIGAIARRPERRDDEKIVDNEDMHARPDQGRGHKAQKQHGVREGERVCGRIEDVGFEQMRRVRCQLVSDPGEPPDVEGRIWQIRELRPPEPRERPAHDDCDAQQRQGDEQWARLSARLRLHASSGHTARERTFTPAARSPSRTCRASAAESGVSPCTHRVSA